MYTDAQDRLMRKTDYHTLARYVQPDALDPEIGQMLDRIAATALAASPPEDRWE